MASARMSALQQIHPGTISGALSCLNQGSGGTVYENSVVYGILRGIYLVGN